MFELDSPELKDLSPLHAIVSEGICWVVGLERTEFGARRLVVYRWRGNDLQMVSTKELQPVSGQHYEVTKLDVIHQRYENEGMDRVVVLWSQVEHEVVRDR